MTREEAIEKLKAAQGKEDGHYDADVVLRDLLKSLGYEDVVEEYLKVKRWYS